MILKKILIPLCIILFACSVTSDDILQIKRRGLFQASQNYRYHHPPFSENYENNLKVSVPENTNDEKTIYSSSDAKENGFESIELKEKSVEVTDVLSDDLKNPVSRNLKLYFKLPVSVVDDEIPISGQTNEIKSEQKQENYIFQPQEHIILNKNATTEKKLQNIDNESESKGLINSENINQVIQIQANEPKKLLKNTDDSFKNVLRRLNRQRTDQNITRIKFKPIQRYVHQNIQTNLRTSDSIETDLDGDQYRNKGITFRPIQRFIPYGHKNTFVESEKTNGKIESDLSEVVRSKKLFENANNERSILNPVKKSKFKPLSRFVYQGIQNKFNNSGLEGTKLSNYQITENQSTETNAKFSNINQDKNEQFIQVESTESGRLEIVNSKKLLENAVHSTNTAGLVTERASNVDESTTEIKVNGEDTYQNNKKQYNQINSGKVEKSFVSSSESVITNLENKQPNEGRRIKIKLKPLSRFTQIESQNKFKNTTSASTKISSSLMSESSNIETDRKFDNTVTKTTLINYDEIQNKGEEISQVDSTESRPFHALAKKLFGTKLKKSNVNLSNTTKSLSNTELSDSITEISLTNKNINQTRNEKFINTDSSESELSKKDDSSEEPKNDKTKIKIRPFSSFIHRGFRNQNNNVSSTDMKKSNILIKETNNAEKASEFDDSSAESINKNETGIQKQFETVASTSTKISGSLISEGDYEAAEKIENIEAKIKFTDTNQIKNDQISLVNSTESQFSQVLRSEKLFEKKLKSTNTEPNSFLSVKIIDIKADSELSDIAHKTSNENVNQNDWAATESFNATNINESSDTKENFKITDDNSNEYRRKQLTIINSSKPRLPIDLSSESFSGKRIREKVNAKRPYINSNSYRMSKNSTRGYRVSQNKTTNLNTYNSNSPKIFGAQGTYKNQNSANVLRDTSGEQTNSEIVRSNKVGTQSTNYSFNSESASTIRSSTVGTQVSNYNLKESGNSNNQTSIGSKPKFSTVRTQPRWKIFKEQVNNESVKSGTVGSQASNFGSNSESVVRFRSGKVGAQTIRYRKVDTHESNYKESETSREKASIGVESQAIKYNQNAENTANFRSSLTGTQANNYNFNSESEQTDKSSRVTQASNYNSNAKSATTSRFSRIGSQATNYNSNAENIITVISSGYGSNATKLKLDAESATTATSSRDRTHATDINLNSESTTTAKSLLDFSNSESVVRFRSGKVGAQTTRYRKVDTHESNYKESETSGEKASVGVKSQAIKYNQNAENTANFRSSLTGTQANDYNFNSESEQTDKSSRVTQASNYNSNAKSATTSRFSRIGSQATNYNSNAENIITVISSGYGSNATKLKLDAESATTATSSRDRTHATDINLNSESTTTAKSLLDFSNSESVVRFRSGKVGAQTTRYRKVDTHESNYKESETSGEKASVGVKSQAIQYNQNAEKKANFRSSLTGTQANDYNFNSESEQTDKSSRVTQATNYNSNTKSATTSRFSRIGSQATNYNSNAENTTTVISSRYGRNTTKLKLDAETATTATSSRDRTHATDINLNSERATTAKSSRISQVRNYKSNAENVASSTFGTQATKYKLNTGRELTSTEYMRSSRVGSQATNYNINSKNASSNSGRVTQATNYNSNVSATTARHSKTETLASTHNLNAAVNSSRFSARVADFNLNTGNARTLTTNYKIDAKSAATSNADKNQVTYSNLNSENSATAKSVKVTEASNYNLKSDSAVTAKLSGITQTSNENPNLNSAVYVRPYRVGTKSTSYNLNTESAATTTSSRATTANYNVNLRSAATINSRTTETQANNYRSNAESAGTVRAGRVKTQANSYKLNSESENSNEQASISAKTVKSSRTRSSEVNYNVNQESRTERTNTESNSSRHFTGKYNRGNRKYEPIVPIIASQNHVFAQNGHFSYSYEAADGTKAFSRGQLKKYDEDAKGEAVEGGFSYTDQDGNDFSLSYTADENGYQPVGSHLPTPPPIPPAIARALAYLATKPTEESVTEFYDYVPKNLGNRNGARRAL